MKSDNIEVEVIPQYLPEQSDPDKKQYFFIYTIRIRNNGLFAVQVISRHWIIQDGNEQVQEVRGLGVIGQQPLIAVGDVFEYTSGCPLSTPYGTMKGSYHCVGENGVPFDVDIPEFVLSVPRTLH
ncbi:MAG: Co2+/Mg2+ efflux protein ApaG [Alcaligenaceae bacterium]|nr:Co2+/Mg2+ efflux protein ApaG [Alcaligenaceae bacterium]